MIIEPNRRAFLHMIRAAEGTAGENGYRMLFGKKLFDDFSKHPRIRKEFLNKAGKRIVTTAAGAYQITATTWDTQIQPNLHLPDFSPESQDKAAIFLIRTNGALGDIDAGRIERAITKVNGVWASLPGAGYNQPERSLAFVLAAYNSYLAANAA
jgi:muramidase (phage lysozyme)